MTDQDSGFKAARLALGLTQSELGARLGVDIAAERTRARIRGLDPDQQE